MNAPYPLSRSDWSRLSALYGRLLKRLDAADLDIGNEAWKAHRRLLLAAMDDADERAAEEAREETARRSRMHVTDEQMAAFVAWCESGASTAHPDYPKIKEGVR